jgi:hypothetical protein
MATAQGGFQGIEGVEAHLARHHELEAAIGFYRADGPEVANRADSSFRKPLLGHETNAGKGADGSIAHGRTLGCFLDAFAGEQVKPRCDDDASPDEGP